MNSEKSKLVGIGRFYSIFHYIVLIIFHLMTKKCKAKLFDMRSLNYFPCRVMAVFISTECNLKKKSIWYLPKDFLLCGNAFLFQSFNVNDENHCNFVSHYEHISQLFRFYSKYFDKFF